MATKTPKDSKGKANANPTAEPADLTPLAKPVPVKKRLAREWEKVLFWMLLVFLTAAGLMWIAGIGSYQPTPRSGGRAKARSSLLNENALAFLESMPDPDLSEGSPFTFTTKLRQPKRTRRPWEKGTGPKPTARPTPKPTPKPTPATTRPKAAPKAKPTQTAGSTPKPKAAPKPKPTDTASATQPKATPQAEPATPPKPPEVRVVHYKGIIVTATGRQVAFVRVQDPKTKKAASGFLSKGDEQNGVVIQDFSEESLRVSAPGGKPKTLPIGKQAKIVLE